MIDVRRYNIMFRGYPVAFLGKELVLRFPEFVLGPHAALDVLSRAADLAGPGELADWHFRATYCGVEVWLERTGGVRDEHGHHGGFWTLYLPEER